MRPLLLALLLLASLVPHAASASSTCVTLPDGVVACGALTLERTPAATVATAETSSTGPVTWRLTLDTTDPACHEETTFGGGVAAVACGPAACAVARLYADGTLVEQATDC